MATSSAPASAPLTAREEWRANWAFVLAAMVGSSFVAVPPTTLGVFMKPLEADFGWSRTLLSSGLSIHAAVSLLLTPIAGGLADKVGARRCVLPGLFAVGVVFASFSLLNGAPWQWWVAWSAFSLSALFVRSVIWTSGVSKVFNTSRGLAISVVLIGLGIAQIVGTPVAHALMSEFGWRNAFLLMGICWPGAGLLLVFLFFRTAEDRRARASGNGQISSPRVTHGGLTLAEAVRDPVIIRIALATFLTMGICAPIGIHLVPIMEWSGAPRSMAAILAASLGVGSLAGNLTSGWLMDRIRSGMLPSIVSAVPLAGSILLWSSSGSPVLLGLGAALVGVGTGGVIQVAVYLTTRYAGVRNFGRIYGVISSMMSLAAGTSPIISGLIYDNTNSYDLLFMIAAPVLLVAMMLFSRLGPYRDFPNERAGTRPA